MWFSFEMKKGAEREFGEDMYCPSSRLTVGHSFNPLSLGACLLPTPGMRRCNEEGKKLQQQQPNPIY
jgi:hypothetical protein